jgi:hypothetical protein
MGRTGTRIVQRREELGDYKGISIGEKRSLNSVPVLHSIYVKMYSKAIILSNDETSCDSVGLER